MSDDNRTTARIIAAAVIVAALVVAGTMLYLNAQKEDCVQWQQKVLRDADALGGGIMVQSYAQEYEDERPKGCAVPRDSST